MLHKILQSMKNLLFLVLFSIPLTISAKIISGTTGDCVWSYDSDSKTLTISGHGAMGDESTLNNQIPWTNFKSYITTVIIEDGVTNISEGAFANCTSLQSIRMPESITRIERTAFYKCASLQSIRMPESIKIIDSYAFSECSSLETIDLPSNLYMIGDYAFYHCLALSEIHIPSKVYDIGTKAFYWCYNLKLLTISSKQASIGSDAFSKCSGLHSVIAYMNVPDSDPNTFFNNISLYCTLTVPYGKRDVYRSRGWNESLFGGGVFEMPDVNEEPVITLDNLGITTFCCGKDLDFSNSELKAYIASAINPNNREITLTRVNCVPTGTGIVVVGTQGTYEIPTTESKTVVANLLVGVTEEREIFGVNGSYTNFVLRSSDSEIAFYPVDNVQTMPANTAYLPIPTYYISETFNDAKKITVVFEDGDNWPYTTGINEIESSTQQTSPSPIYDISGRRLNQVPERGLYIQNGKKYVVR